MMNGSKMNTISWFAHISFKQRMILFSTLSATIAIIALGVVTDRPSAINEPTDFNVNMSIQEIAPKLGVTGKALARELNLPIDTPKKKPLISLNVTEETLQHSVTHLLSHRDSKVKYYVFTALVSWGLVFLARLGRPDTSDEKNRRAWYPRAPYVISLLCSVIVAGFILGKSPNPMEGAVKVFKSMVGLYPDPGAKVIVFIFFIILALVGNKIICGWACPFGASQELLYSIPIVRTIKKRKLPFLLTNTIRGSLFVVMLLFLFGIIGGRKGTVIYHFMNPFNLFNLDFETLSILLTIIIALLGSLILYRPFCQFICPFGFISWMIERFSIFKVRIRIEICTHCGACIKSCPVEAAKGRVNGKILPADCFSCARCLNVCPVDAVHYASFFK